MTEVTEVTAGQSSEPAAARRKRIGGLGWLIIVLTVCVPGAWLAYFFCLPSVAKEAANWTAYSLGAVYAAAAVGAVACAARPEVKLWQAVLLLVDAFALLIAVFAAMYWVISQQFPLDFFPDQPPHKDPAQTLGAVDAAYFALGTLTGGTGPFNAHGGVALVTRMVQIVLDYAFTTFAVAAVVARYSEWIRRKSPSTEPLAGTAAAKGASSGESEGPGTETDKRDAAKAVKDNTQAEASGDDSTAQPAAPESEEPRPESAAPTGLASAPESEASVGKGRHSAGQSVPRGVADAQQPDDAAATDEQRALAATRRTVEE